MSKEVGIWIRVSTEEQAEGDSPEHHEKRARLYAEMKEWNVKEVYNLSGMTGSSVMDYPETKRMLADIKRGHITGLIFSKLARFARNTRELLEFADIFKSNDADLISLQESLDTSSPAGRFFYTLLAGLAEWEREEIVSRVKASIPIRAKLGKSLGGEAPYGYQYVNGVIALKDDEARVRKLMFELFLKHKRKGTVIRILTEQGYRSRDGKEFTDTTIHRYLSDPIAKGLRRMNYYKSIPYRGDGQFKDESEWIFQPAPAIVTEEMWDEANRILNSLTTANKKVRRTAVHLFSGVVGCHCGGKMYMRSNSPRYVCHNKECKNQIHPDDLEFIFKEQLKGFLVDDIRIKEQITEQKASLEEYKGLLKDHEDKVKALRIKIRQILDLYHEGKIDKDAFPTYHQPLHDELKQRENTMIETQAIIDMLSINTLSQDQVLEDARDLQERWDTFSPEEKRTIIEEITGHLIIGKEDIDIKLNYLPTLSQEPPTNGNNTTGAIIATILPHPPFKLVQIPNSPIGRGERLEQSERQGRGEVPAACLPSAWL